MAKYKGIHSALQCTQCILTTKVLRACLSFEVVKLEMKQIIMGPFINNVRIHVVLFSVEDNK